MTVSDDIATLARWMAADFSNQQQAFDNPPLFAHVRACLRPLSLTELDGISFYLEQAYQYDLNRPYRTRVLRIKPESETEVEGNAKSLIIENYAIERAEEFFGASRDPQRLATLTPDRLERLCGCNFVVVRRDHDFEGVVEPGNNCRVERNGQSTYLDSRFEIGEHHFRTLDRGRNLDTGERVWGSVAGAFEFQRVTSFAHELRL
ncbi:MAG: chromophore lyase CpcT/CpeT [Sodalinema sp.]|uniref:chromophore lyase CpcT/CpeT n=1 Tax=Sodalinema sp. TaxID=3080550 RepID=UPI0012004B07|nr:MAG: chorismate-binding protein [Phormidium sp. SL48-SHIP]